MALAQGVRRSTPTKGHKRGRYWGRIGLVIGGSKSIGLETAKALVDEACPVAVVARTQADLDTAADIRHRGGDVIGVAADISLSAGADRGSLNWRSK